MKTRTVFVAFDDAVFDTAEACRAHEAAHVETRLVGLTIERVQAAVNREEGEIELADAIEELGNRIAKARREAGEFRRGRKAAPEVEATRSPEREAEDMGRAAFRHDTDHEPPAHLTGSLLDAWITGHEYERAISARAA